MQHNSYQDAVVTHSVTVSENLSWRVMVHGSLVDKEKCSALPETIKTKLAVSRLLQVVDGLSVCAGHPEVHFVDFVN